VFRPHALNFGPIQNSCPPSACYRSVRRSCILSRASRVKSLSREVNWCADAVANMECDLDCNVFLELSKSS
jgi:hypothetical protein